MLFGNKIVIKSMIHQLWKEASVKYGVAENFVICVSWLLSPLTVV